jgi:hypothetical protein
MQNFFDYQQFSLCMQQMEIIEMINVYDVQLYNLISYLIEKSQYLTVWHFKVTKDTYSVLEVKHHPIGQL